MGGICSSTKKAAEPTSAAPESKIVGERMVAEEIPVVADVMTISKSIQLEFEAASEEDYVKLEKEFFPAALAAVEKNEPGTRLWFGLKRQALDFIGQKPEDCAGKYAIIDFLVDDEAVDLHVHGGVVDLVTDTFGASIKGGLMEGFLGHAKVRQNLLTNGQALFDKQRMASKGAYMLYVPFKCGKPEYAEQVVKFFREVACPTVKAVEPKCCFWTAVQSPENPSEVAIIDIFENMEGVKEHLNDPAVVVAEMKKTMQAVPDLIESGLEGGVVANVRCYELIAKKITDIA